MSKTVKLGLLGDNLGRSRAKHLHELLGKIYGLDVTYDPMDLLKREKPVLIEEELERCRKEGFHGVNVTHPYKRKAFEQVKTMPGFPKGLTSVNTVLLSGEELLADNTDFTGCCRAFSCLFNETNKPGRVLMMGAGGVGVAIAYALKRMGVTELVVHDINRGVAVELVNQMVECGHSARLADKELVEEMRLADGLINATPIGMFQYPGNPFPEEGFGKQKWAFDAVYTPQYTEFLKKCQSSGIETMTGFNLFLHQGLDAFERFTGIAADEIEAKAKFLECCPLE